MWPPSSPYAWLARTTIASAFQRMIAVMRSSIARSPGIDALALQRDGVAIGRERSRGRDQPQLLGVFLQRAQQKQRARRTRPRESPRRAIRSSRASPRDRCRAHRRRAGDAAPRSGPLMPVSTANGSAHPQAAAGGSQAFSRSARINSSRAAPCRGRPRQRRQARRGSHARRFRARAPPARATKTRRLCRDYGQGYFFVRAPASLPEIMPNTAPRTNESMSNISGLAKEPEVRFLSGPTPGSAEGWCNE